jgi:ABC-2 type transport system permease protein
MMGKIVGIGSVGLTQIAIWLGALVVSGIAAPETIVGTYLRSLDERSLVAFILFYVSGYLLFATLYAGVGAMCSSMEDAQQLQWPVVFLLMVPIFLIGPAIEDPGRPLVTILSFVPYFSPVLMLLRISAGEAGLLDMIIALTLNAGMIILSAWLVGRVFRVGILMTGKRPAFREIWRWMTRG